MNYVTNGAEELEFDSCDSVDDVKCGGVGLLERSKIFMTKYDYSCKTTPFGGVYDSISFCKSPIDRQYIQCHRLLGWLHIHINIS